MEATILNPIKGNYYQRNDHLSLRSYLCLQPYHPP